MSWKTKRDQAWRSSQLTVKAKMRKVKKVYGTMSPLEYSVYLKSKRWRIKRGHFIIYLKQQGKFFCYRCKKPGEVWYPIHHLTYEHAGDERFSEMRLTCPECHNTIHNRT